MMQAKKQKNKKMYDSLLFASKLFAVIILAFFAALCFRRSVGVLAMLPIAFIFCGLAACIGIKAYYKPLIFALTVFLLNTIEQSDQRVVLMFTALCLLASLAAEYAGAKLRERKKSGYIVASVGAVLCVGLSVFFIGNPFTAITASKTLNDYASDKYPDTEDAYLGDFDFTKIYYNYQTKAYSIDAVSSVYPTEPAMITYHKGNIRDSFQGLLENKLKSPYESRFTAYLRKIFPTENFSVTCTSIAQKPDENIFISASGELDAQVSYEIHLGGVQTADEMMRKVKYYMSLLDRNGAVYDELTFKSGTGPFVRRSIKIDRSRQKFQTDYELRYVPAGFIDSFSNFELIPLEEK